MVQEFHFRLPYQQIYTFHQFIFNIQYTVLWAPPSYLLLKTAFNTCIYTVTCYFSLASVPCPYSKQFISSRQVPGTGTYRTVLFPLFVSFLLVYTIQQLFDICIPTIYSPFCCVICLACLFSELQNWIVSSLLPVPSVPYLQFIKKNFTFLLSRR